MSSLGIVNPVLAYHEKIESGCIIADRKVKRWYRHLAEEIKEPTNEWYYDAARAQHVIDFFQVFLRHSKGRWGGQLIKLELWQMAMLAGLFGFVNSDGHRRFQRLILIVAKKNGKSLISSGIGLYLLMADGEPGAEVYSVATKKDQAKIIYDESRRMRNKSAAIKKRVRAIVSGLYYDEAESFFKALASDADSLDGLNIHGALMDEIHQWRNGRALYNIIADGVSSREQPLIVVTSTAGTVREDIYDEIYDESDEVIASLDEPSGILDWRTFPLIYELDDKKEWIDPDCWIKANPNLGISKPLRYLTEKVELAKKNAKLQRNVLTKEFNVPETSDTTLFTWEEIVNEALFDIKQIKPDYAVGGFDLSVRGDLTAAVVTFMLKDDPTLYVESMYWMPETVLEQHIESDKVPYDLWRDQGLLRICPGNQVDYKMVHAWFCEIQNDLDIYLPWIGYDPAYSSYMIDQLKETFGDDSMRVVRQGFLTLGMPMATIEKMIKAHKVNYNNNPIMRFCLRCLSVEEDRNGNLMPSKRKSTIKRIDGFSAMLNAWTVMSEMKDQYDQMMDYG